MPRDLPQGFVHDSRIPDQTNPFTWTVSIEVPTNPPTRLRLCDQKSSIQFTFNSVTEQLNTFYPASMRITDVREESDGSLPEISFTVGHASLTLRETLDSYNGLRDQEAVMRILNMGRLDDQSAQVAFKGRVVETSIAADGVTFRVSTESLLKHNFPGRRMVAHHCRHRFGHGACPYPIEDGGAAFSTCPKTLDACKARGDDMVALGYADLLPLRFGGFIGIRRGRRS